jgi:hypothetical protein
VTAPFYVNLPAGSSLDLRTARMEEFHVPDAIAVSGVQGFSTAFLDDRSVQSGPPDFQSLREIGCTTPNRMFVAPLLTAHGNGTASSAVAPSAL